jgi:hypothetical protein
MRTGRRVGAALAAAALISTAVTGPATATDDERAAAREKATRARTSDALLTSGLEIQNVETASHTANYQRSTNTTSTAP